MNAQFSDPPCNPIKTQHETRKDSAMPNRLLKAILLTATSTALLGAPAAFAASSASFTQFSNSAPTSAVNVDYSHIQQFSETFGQKERGRTKISYTAVEQQGQRFLNLYLDRLANVSVSSLSRNDQLAYWLNTHNMLVMQAMTDPKARRDMKQARGTADAPGEMWTQKRITVQGVDLSLHDIEKNIIVANFADKPNAVFGLYQGTKGSPAFKGDGFHGATLDADLEDAARAHLKKNIKVKGSKAQIPAVMQWYAADLFGGDNDALRTHLISVSSDKNAKKLASVTEFEARKFSYSSDEFVIRQQTSYRGSDGGFGGFGGGGGGGGS